MVCDVEVGPGGRLLPRAGAAWRPEPAHSEARVHRQLAALANAPDDRIAAFASVHGKLRRHGNNALGASGPASVAATVSIGQEAMDDVARVEAWFATGAIGSPPPDTEDTLLLVELYAQLPQPIYDTFDAYFAGAESPSSTEPAAFLRIVVPVLEVTRKAVERHRPNPGRLPQMDRQRVKQALRLAEWVSRILGGLEVNPEPLAAVGGPDGLVRQLVSAAPELFAVPRLGDALDEAVGAFLDRLSMETVDDWRSTASLFATRVRSLDLLAGALRPTGVSSADRRELANLYAELAGFRSKLDLAPAELADRIRPLMAADLESQLLAIGSWPMERHALAGLQVRSLVAAWIEVTGATPPIACASAGCGRAFQPTRNRLYCDTCQPVRRRDAVRRSRARSLSADTARESAQGGAKGLEPSPSA